MYKELIIGRKIFFGGSRDFEPGSAELGIRDLSYFATESTRSNFLTFRISFTTSPRTRTFALSLVPFSISQAISRHFTSFTGHNDSQCSFLTMKGLTANIQCLLKPSVP